MTRKSVAGDKLMSSGSEVGNLVVRKVLVVMDASFWGQNMFFRVENRAHWRCVVVA